MAASLPGLEIMHELIQRGYSPVQAAVLAGNMKQESSYDPNSYTASENAHGLISWEGPRWPALQSFAASQGKSPFDRGTQLDFIGHEMSGPEAKAGNAFMASTDLDSAARAAKQYIRWGDNSDNTRLNNARALLGQDPVVAQGGTAPRQSSSIGSSGAAATSSPDAAASSTGIVSAPAPAPQEDPALQASLQAVPKTLAAMQANATPAPLQIQPIDTSPTQNMLRARQLAAAMVSKAINPQGTA